MTWQDLDIENTALMGEADFIDRRALRVCIHHDLGHVEVVGLAPDLLGDPFD
jgi:hypothetical protein